jgi:hypothetical protein
MKVYFYTTQSVTIYFLTYHPLAVQHVGKPGNMLDDQPLPGGNCGYEYTTGDRSAVSEPPDGFSVKGLPGGIVHIADWHRAGGRVDDVYVRGVDDVYV